MTIDKPLLIIITGKPGAGKSTFARILCEKTGLPCVSRDELKQGYVRTFGLPCDMLPEDTNLTVTQTFFDVLRFYSERGVSVVGEAAFRDGVWRYWLEPFADTVRTVVLVCDTDNATAAARYNERALNDPDREYFHGGTVETDGIPPIIESYIPPSLHAPTYRIDTTDGYMPAIDEITRLILNQEE